MAAAVVMQQYSISQRISRIHLLVGKRLNFGISALITPFRNPTEKREQQQEDNNSLGILCVMNQRGTPPNFEACARLLQECANTKSAEGRRAHTQMIKAGIESDIFLGNNLVNMYAKCGQLKDARQVFDKMPERDAVSWNAMIAGYAKFGSTDAARQMFDEMPDRDVVSWNTLIAAYAQNGDGHCEKALKLFCRMLQTGVYGMHAKSLTKCLNVTAFHGML